MCLIALAHRVHPDYPLVVAANRDELYARPTAQAAFWQDQPSILAGRDLECMGTWLGVTTRGRFAAVTNFRDPSEKRSTARSRGGLVSDFLLSDAAPEGFLAALAPHAGEYNGFNLIVGDGASLWYFGSREAEARAIEPGVHGLSNHRLDEPWPKVVRGRMAMEEALGEADPAPPLFAALADATGAPDDLLPDTGVGIAWERRLASPLITGPDYGTRSSTVLTATDGGAIFFEERTLGQTGEPEARRTERLKLQAHQ